MEAPKPMITQEMCIIIKKDLKSENGNDFSLNITFKDNKLVILAEKKVMNLIENYKNEYTINQIQDNYCYFKMFWNGKEILEELKLRIDSKTPILNECNNNIINLVVFLPTSKYKQIEFNLNKDNKINENSDYLKTIIDNLCKKVEELSRENKEIKNKLEKIENEIKLKNINNESTILKKNNFHWINAEVNIVKKSEFVEGFDADILLSQNFGNDYSCTKGNRNHFIEFSFIRIYFLKSIRIKVSYYECSLKTFRVEIISEKGNRNVIGTFIRSKYSDNKDFQLFDINKECKGIKLYLVDNWGSGGGNYILISKIDFYVSD